MSDYISRADAMGAVQDHFNDDGFKGYDDGQKMMDRITALPSANIIEFDFTKHQPRVRNKVNDSLPSAETVHGYTEWLEKNIVEAETFEWLCEDTTDEEWCEKNCKYSSIQAECLRHLYEVSKGGDRWEV